VHIVEQLCKNHESAVATAFDELQDNHGTQRITSMDNDDEDVLYPTNFAILALETLASIVHYCLIADSSASSSML
jgi:hypothetical protein